MIKPRLVEDVTSPQLALARPGRTRKSDYRMPCHGELPDDGAADESGGAGYENAHAASP
jgi:hypothetical protein